MVSGRELAVKDSGFAGFFKRLGEKYNFRESFWKKLQLRIMPKEIRETMNKDSRVIVDDGVVKLHTNDRRELYREKYIAALGKL